MEISQEKLDELLELNYIQGERSVLVQQLHHILSELSYSYDDTTEDQEPGNLVTIARMVAEREAAIASLRSVCHLHGDNNWDTDLHMADIINKHLANHLDEN